MGKQIKVVIGANFGDEGKGLMTDYFCHQLAKQGVTLNIRYNGGAQAGHTVVTPDGRQNIYSHFGAGSFLPHVVTYLSPEFILNPILFCREWERLNTMDCHPKIYIDKACRITTPIDMLINQIAERSRGTQRHGSCGVGVFETVTRYDAMYQGNFQSDFPVLTAENLLSAPLFPILLEIREQWLPARLEALGIKEVTEKERELLACDVILENWIEQLKIMRSCCEIADLHILEDYKNLVFEGAQGLLLDYDFVRFAPHLTTSKTGSYHPKNLLLQAGLTQEEIEICYVTRAYFTRHGAGPFPTECEKTDILPATIQDWTNHTNEFQGAFRYGYFDLELFHAACREDVEYLRGKFQNLQHTIAVTHLDETQGALIVSQGQRCPPSILKDIGVTTMYEGTGRTRHACNVMA